MKGGKGPRGYNFRFQTFRTRLSYHTVPAVRQVSFFYFRPGFFFFLLFPPERKSKKKWPMVRISGLDDICYGYGSLGPEGSESDHKSQSDSVDESQSVVRHKY